MSTPKKRKTGKFDIRHKETLKLFLREYFELFFPDLAERMLFETAIFLDKELIELFGDEENQGNDTEQQKITDALILIGIVLDGKEEGILIHWEQESEREKDFEKRMFHYFCGIYFKHQQLVFSIAMFTDPVVEWRKPVEDKFTLSLRDYPICEFHYRLIKLKNYKAEEFEEKIGKNPLAAAYLPLTDYPKEDRPVIKAKAIRGIADVPKGRKQSTLLSLINESIKLDSEEEKTFQQLIQADPSYKEVKMLESIEEVGYERGFEEGGIRSWFLALEKTAANLLRLGGLTKEQIAEATGLDIARVNELEENLKSDGQSFS